MIRTVLLPVTAAVLAFGPLNGLGIAAAEPSQDPAPGDTTAYLIGACWDPSQPVDQRPATLVYGCDKSSVMEDMTWTAWGADGAEGTGIDSAVECQPNCAEGAHLSNPIVVHAWNPQPAATPGCPDGVQFFGDYTVAYPQGVPPWVKPGTSWTEDVDYVYIDNMPAVHFKNQGPLSCTPVPS